jgi:hypothetical protein
MLLLAYSMAARAADDSTPPDEAFLEYLGTIDSESDDWTWFADHEDPPKTQSERTGASEKEDARQPASHDP